MTVYDGDFFNRASGIVKGKTKLHEHRCWKQNHTPLELGGGVILGAACAHPQEGYDVYIGFDYMHANNAKAHYPWEKSKGPIEFEFRIPDMGVPTPLKDFRKMLTWMVAQLKKGKKLHIGCIGGHGRTGVVLAALVARLKVSDDPIAWVRKHHCKKAVESKKQVDWLVKYFNAKPAEATKSYTSPMPGKGGKPVISMSDFVTQGIGYDGSSPVVGSIKRGTMLYKFVASKRSIW